MHDYSMTVFNVRVWNVGLLYDYIQCMTTRVYDYYMTVLND